MYSSAIKMTTIQLILTLAIKYDLKQQMVDIKGVYLNRKLDDMVYIWQPQQFIKKGEENLVCKLNNSIYGLKQSG